MKRRLIWTAGVVLCAVPVLLSGGLWFASNQLLFPSFHGVTRDLADCRPELEALWGPACGNLRESREFEFDEVRTPSVNGYALPGWMIRTADNDLGRARGAILLVHGGGSDRRELTRHVRFFLQRGLDVLTIDLTCHGEAPCPSRGLTYGERESRDVFSAYLQLTRNYETVYAMGSSVGAAAILIALPEMPKLGGVIAENPMASFERLIEETPASRSIPGWFTRLLIDLTRLRGRFAGLLSPEHSLPLAGATPIFFIHSRRDEVVPQRQTAQLAASYPGPKSTWFPDAGAHGGVREANPAEYERRLAEFLETFTALSASGEREADRTTGSPASTAGY